MNGTLRTRVLALLPAIMLALPSAPFAADNVKDTAHPEVKSGTYCPDEASTFLVLEELTVAIKSVSQARESLLVLSDVEAATTLLTRADAALALANGRGSGARVANLIDAALAAKRDGQPKATLTWMLPIRLALKGLPDDPARSAAARDIDSAEAIIQGQETGDVVKTLLQAKQYLMCDPLHIPLRQALSHLARLRRDIAAGTKPSDDDFSVEIDQLNRAMDYGLRHLNELEKR